MQTDTTKTITLRTSSGTRKGEAILVAWKSQGLRPTQNPDGRCSRSIGIDAQGNAYETVASGWRRATTNTESIRRAFA